MPVKIEVLVTGNVCQTTYSTVYIQKLYIVHVCISTPKS